MKPCLNSDFSEMEQTGKKLLSQRIKAAALEIGFDACGITRAEYRKDDASYLRQWLDRNFHGSMTYMENNFEKRVDATKLVEGAKTVISVLLNYYPEKIQEDPTAPKISKYAYGEDYHQVIKRKLKALAEKINHNIIPAGSRAFVDSAPILDRSNARYAGLGWIGKNATLISPEFGSFVFIGELVTDIEPEYDVEISERCGNCTLCMDACPTGAISEPRVVNATKCITYHTNVSEEPIPEEFRDVIGLNVYGCDICQDVCPYNRNCKPTKIPEFKPHPGLLRLSRDEWFNLSQEQFDILFNKTAIQRKGYERLKKNLDFLKQE
ncbi:MAG: tRNA epoxyqueuosine(34) reductase QueG [Bacteroidota bacterium]